MSAPYSINIVAELDALYDINFGIVREIKEEFNIKDNNGEYIFDQSIINADNYFLRYSLYTMRYNDLPELLNTSEENRNMVYSICNQLRDITNKYYTKVLNLSPPTTIHNLAKVYEQTDGVINVTVICKNKIEESFIKKNKLPVRTIMGSYESRISSYDVIIVNYFGDILKYYNNTKFEGKEILVPTYGFNMDDKYPDKPIIELVALLGDTNKIKTICPYKNFVLPVED